MDIFTERRTPMAVKISPAGAYAYRINISVQIFGEQPRLRPTKPTALIMVAENALMTSTVGSSHFVSGSSLLRDW